jgi:hypothetical protein
MLIAGNPDILTSKNSFQLLAISIQLKAFLLFSGGLLPASGNLMAALVLSSHSSIFG